MTDGFVNINQQRELVMLLCVMRALFAISLFGLIVAGIGWALD